MPLSAKLAVEVNLIQITFQQDYGSKIQPDRIPQLPCYILHYLLLQSAVADMLRFPGLKSKISYPKILGRF